MVKVLLDTNVLVAALSKDHEMYSTCKPLLDRIRLDQTTQGFISTHSLAECYSILTRMPPPYRVSPTTANYLLTENFSQFKISWTAEDYQAVIQRVVQLNISGS
jgi:predicted nucleic acid-binding protein